MNAPNRRPADAYSAAAGRADLSATPLVEEVVTRARARVRATGTRLDVNEILVYRDADRTER